MPSRQDRRRAREAARDVVPGRGGDRRVHPAGRSVLRVDRIIVEGLARTDVEAFAGALDRELRSRLRDCPAESGETRRIERVDAGVVEVRGHDRVTAVAERLANNIVDGPHS